MIPDYKPNARLALADAIATNVSDKLSSREIAALVLDDLILDGWLVVPAEVVAAAHEDVETHTEVTELTGVLETVGPRFVDIGVWVNPEHVEVIDPDEIDENACWVWTNGNAAKRVGFSAAEVVAKLTGKDGE